MSEFVASRRPSIAGANQQVLFNDHGVEGSSANFTFDKANSNVSITGNLSVTGSISGVGGSPVPATVTGLVLWYKMDVLDSPTSYAQAFLGNFAPNYAGMGGIVAATGGKVSSTQLNSANVLTLVGGEDYQLSTYSSGPTLRGPILKTSTLFAVVNPSSLSGGSGFGNDIMSGTNNDALEIRVTNTGLLDIVQQGVAVVGTSTTAVATVGSWSQFNYTYDSVGGAWAIRSGRANNGSGTNALTINQPQTSILWFGGGGATIDWVGSIAEIIVYNRVLSGTEITTIENYLNTKWGV